MKRPRACNICAVVTLRDFREIIDGGGFESGSVCYGIDVLGHELSGQETTRVAGNGAVAMLALIV